MRFFAALAVASAAVLVSVPLATPSSSARVERRAALEAAVLREVNRVRLAHGLLPLHATPSLRTAARSHSQAMLEHGFFGHDSPDGTSFGERIRRHYTNRGWRTWSVGEALLAGQGTSIAPRAIVEAWLESASHRDVILSPSWRDAGIGALYAPTAPREYDGAATIVVTADFGVRKGRLEPL